MFKATPPLPQLSASALLRKYAHFDELPPPPPASDPPPPPPPEDKKFSQADLDRIAGETRKSAKQAAITDLMKDLGFEKPEDLKALVKAAKERDEAEKTEAQKAVEAAAKAAERAEKAEKALEARNAEIDAEKRAAARDSAVTKALTTANAKAEKVLKLLRADHAADLDAVLKEDGTVDEKKVTALVETARKAYPEDFGKGGVGSPSNSGGRPPSREIPKVQTSGRL